MARNYTEFWSSKINDGSGNFIGFIKATRSECEAATLAYLSSHPIAFAVWENQRGYYLHNKTNIIGVLNVINAHYPSFWASTWTFFQDGFVAKESPRDTWSYGE